MPAPERTPTGPLATPRWHWAALAALLAVQGGLAWHSSLTDSVVFDEVPHFAAGESYWQTRDFRLDAENPPLVPLWATLPLRVIPHPPIPTESIEWRCGMQWRTGANWLTPPGSRGRLIHRGRAMMLALLLAFTLAVYGVSRASISPSAGLLAAAAVVVWPSFLAHGRLVNSDVPVTLAFLVSIWSCTRLFEHPTLGRWLAAASACAALFLTKFSAVLVLPVLVALLVILSWRRGGAVWRRNVALSLGLAVFAWGAIWAAYGARFSMFAADVANWQELPPEDARRVRREKWAELIDRCINERDTVLVPWALTTARQLRLAPEGYLYGFLYTYASSQARSAYLMGAYSDAGWRSFFPVAFAVKTPLGILALIALGGAALLRARSALLQQRVLPAALFAFAALYGTTAVLGNLNIGERHIFPVYPALLLIAGAAVHWLRTRAGRAAVTLCLLGATAESLLNHPHHLAFVNAAAGGPEMGWRWLVDSSYDWGQDLERLRRWAQRSTAPRPLRVSYFGAARPTAYVDALTLPSYLEHEPTDPLGPGTYIVSITQRLGVYDPFLRPGVMESEVVQAGLRDMRRLAEAELAAAAPAAARAEHAELRSQYPHAVANLVISRLAARPPDEIVGRTLWIYHVSAAEWRQLAGEFAVDFD